MDHRKAIYIHAPGRIQTREPYVRAINTRPLFQIFPKVTGLPCACHFYMNSTVFKNGLRTCRVNQVLADSDSIASSAVPANLTSLLCNKPTVWSEMELPT
jgi:hypothetical protein